MYEKARDILRDIFEEGSITIYPYALPYNRPNKPYDLRQYGYDKCIVNTKYQRFKSDLLLFRSQEENKGYISINIRGRRREEDFPYPKGLRIIDIVFKAIGSEETTRNRLNKGNLIGDLGMIIEYTGFKV